jgi:nucleotide-binding universal stress UspA family protein
MKLLIGYDGSDCANAALDDLDRAGLPEVAEVVILCVADVFLPPDSGAKEEAVPLWLTARINQARAHTMKAVEEARATAEHARSRVQSDHPGWRIQAEACADSPGWGIIKRAGQWQADLVTVGAHGHSETLGLFLGSISQRVLHDSPCSVRVGRTPKSTKPSPARVIVGADGSSDSEMALRQVARRRWPAGSAIRVLTTVDSLLAASLAHGSTSSASQTERGHSETSIDQINEAASEILREAGLDVSSVITHGKPTDILVREAKQWNADCIFLGAKGLRGIRSFLLGSVSAGVAARAPCSVEVVRSLAIPPRIV